MEDLSLHILDVVENSIRAKSANVKIRLCENAAKDLLVLEVTDDGEGMDEVDMMKCLDPFYTTKSGKDVGLGLPFLGQSAEETGGTLTIESEKGRGTRIVATYILSHIDRRPFGDLEETIQCLKMTHPEVNIFYEYLKINNR